MANNIAYGLSAPLLPVFPAPKISQRAPTVEDKLTVGQWWIDEVGNQAYILTSITNNQANWSTLTIMGVGVFNAVEATTGNIVADLGNIIATVGNISAGGTITSGASLTVATGDLGILLGDLNVNTGNIIITTGNLRVTAGDIDTIAGDINSAAAITAATTITAAGNIRSTAGNIIATTGDIEATAGNLLAGGAVAAATGIATHTGGITATAGDITATAGNVVITAGNLAITVGNASVGGIVDAGGDIHGAASIIADGAVSGNTIGVDTTTPGGGQYLIRGNPFMHCGNNFVNQNGFFGFNAGNFTFTGSGNVGLGTESLFVITASSANTALGAFSMTSFDTGLASTAVGYGALNALTSGDKHTCVGANSLGNALTGSYLIGIGFEAGINYAGAESSNICLGNAGLLGESNVMRLGTDGNAAGQQNKCYIAGDVTTARSITATTGNITTTAGDFVASTAGKGVTLGGGAKVVSGAGNPNGVVTAPQGSLYLNLTGSGAADRAWINTNSGTAWTNLVTAA